MKRVLNDNKVEMHVLTVTDGAEELFAGAANESLVKSVRESAFPQGCKVTPRLIAFRCYSASRRVFSSSDNNSQATKM